MASRGLDELLQEVGVAEQATGRLVLRMLLTELRRTGEAVQAELDAASDDPERLAEARAVAQTFVEAGAGLPESLALLDAVIARLHHTDGFPDLPAPGDRPPAGAARRREARWVEALPPLARLAPEAATLLGRRHYGEAAVAVAEAAETASRDVRRALLHRLAQIQAQRLADPDAAIRTLLDLLESDPTDRLTQLALADLYRAHGRWAALKQVLDIRLELAPSEQERMGVELELADLLGEHLDDEPGGLAICARILERRPLQGTALNRLERTSRRLGKLDTLVQAYLAGAEAVADDTLRIEVLLHVARLYETELRRGEAAMECHRIVLGIDPENAVAAAALKRLALVAALGARSD
jgi:tetratricopeptide (TPR) repeat protein